MIFLSIVEVDHLIKSTICAFPFGVQSLDSNHNTILVHASDELNVPTGPLAVIGESMISLVLTRTEGDWKIRSFHNTLVKKQVLKKPSQDLTINLLGQCGTLRCGTSKCATPRCATPGHGHHFPKLNYP